MLQLVRREQQQLQVGLELQLLWLVQHVGEDWWQQLGIQIHHRIYSWSFVKFHLHQHMSMIHVWYHQQFLILVWRCCRCWTHTRIVLIHLEHDAVMLEALAGLQQLQDWHNSFGIQDDIHSLLHTTLVLVLHVRQWYQEILQEIWPKVSRKMHIKLW